jgi:hypothetical protein
MNRFFVLMLLVSCTSKGGDSGNGSHVNGSGPVDVTGRYNVQIAAATGCEGEAFWLEDWVPGPLTISNTDDSLTFDFMGGLAFSGVVDENKNFSMGGEVTFETTESFDTGAEDLMARLEVQGLGSFTKRDGCWEMDGDLTVLVDQNNDGLEFNDCTLEGPVKATQISGGTCDGIL